MLRLERLARLLEKLLVYFASAERLNIWLGRLTECKKGGEMRDYFGSIARALGLQFFWHVTGYLWESELTASAVTSADVSRDLRYIQ